MTGAARFPDPNDDITSARDVSFWPGGNPGKGLKGLIEAQAAELQGNHWWTTCANSAATPRPGQIVIGQQIKGDDVWGQAPDDLVNLWSLAIGRPRQLGL